MKIKYLITTLFFVFVSVKAQIQKDSVYNKIDSIFIKSTTNNSQKTSYVLNKKRLIKNIKTPEIISSIPYVTVANDKSIFYKGKKIEMILINSVKSSLSELNSIIAEDIILIELIYSAIDLSSSENKLALNIKTKFKPGIKGYIEASPAIFQDFFYEGAGLSIKNKNTYISIMHSNLWNANSGYVEQQYLNENKVLSTARNLYQPFDLISFSHILRDKSFNLKFLYSGVQESSSSKTENDKYLNQFNINSYNLNFLYDWTFKKYTFKLNSDFILNDNIYTNENYSNNKSNQNFREFAISPNLVRKIKNGNVGLGMIFTNRKLNSQNTSNNLGNENIIDQSIYNLILAVNYNFNKSFSISTNLKYQNYSDNILSKNLFLPYLKIYKSVKKFGEIELLYKKNVVRPNIYSLSGANYNEIDGSITNSNPFLKFQESDLLDVSFTPSFKKLGVTLGLSYEKTKNQINSEKTIVNNVINNNIVNSNSTEAAFNLSLSYPISDNFNINSFYKHIYLENRYDNSLLEGTYSIYNISLNGKILKNYNFTLNSSYRSKIYDANYFIKLKPDFSITISKSFIEELYTSLEFRNILDNDSKRNFTISDSNKNQFKNISYVNSRLLLLTITYNFGKSFEMKKKNINSINNDILPK